MNIDYKVPFYANTPDDTHCLQAGLKSILKYFMPEKDFSWDELDKASAKVKDLWTWPMAAMIWMQDQGFEVHNVELFDYERFIDDGVDYIVEKYGADIAATQDKMSDIAQEQEISKDFIKKIKIENRPAVREDIVHFLKAGYLLGASINIRALNNEKGYIGHFVVIKGMLGDNLVLHDPGSPAVENRKVAFEQFNKSWANPSPDERNLMAFKKVK